MLAIVVTVKHLFFTCI